VEPFDASVGAPTAAVPLKNPATYIDIVVEVNALTASSEAPPTLDAPEKVPLDVALAKNASNPPTDVSPVEPNVAVPEKLPPKTG
jgi:hypothetical protein